jgi:predicted protein tyrosine phosphatase
VPWEHITFPMWNSGMRDAPSLEPLTREIVKRLRQGRNVLIHCDSGVGRVGTVAVAVLTTFWPELHNPELSTRLDQPERPTPAAVDHKRSAHERRAQIPWIMSTLKRSFKKSA